MPIQFDYIAELNCLHAIGKGRLGRQDFLAYHRNITISNPPPTLLILSDYRELDASDLTTSDIEEIRTSALSRTENKYSAVKEALVVSDALVFGLSRMYDGVIHSENYEAGVFTDMNDAKRWLGLSDAFAAGKPSL
jgi:hypothetical protein